VPPIPAAQVSPTSAGLAAGPLPGARPLAINGSGGVQAVPASNSGSPQPIVVPVPRDTGPASPGVVPVSNTTWTPQPAPNSVEALQQQLKAHGVIWQKEDRLPEGVRFSAIVPSRTQPDATQVYEATGRDLPSAIEAVLQKMDGAR
jgi:hypothetical protein